MSLGLRPKGSKSTTAVYVANTSCGKRQSTKKKALRIVRERPISGMDDKGPQYNGVAWRRVRGAHRGQHRVEIERHYDGDPL